MAVGVAVNKRSYAIAAAAAVVYLALHIPFLAWAPDDIDGTNFLLAMRAYDVREHQPHPPGYPVFVAMARVARAGIGAAASVVGSVEPDTISVLALSACSAVFGALAVFPLVALWRVFDDDRSRALAAAVLAIASPLYWYTGIRPLSDLVGLAFAIGGLAMSLSVMTGERTVPVRRLAMGAFLTGLATGVRVQALWVAGPGLLVALGAVLRRGERRAALLALGAFALGMALWGVPLLLAVGGLDVYADLLGAQAADDFLGTILASEFSVRQLAFALRDTFVLPWGGSILAIPVLAFASGGAARLFLAKPRMLALFVAVFAPYVLLHLLFHATEGTRYALPVVLPVAFLAVHGLRPVTRLRRAVALALVIAAAAAGMRPVAIQARSGSPLARAWTDIRDAFAASRDRPLLAMHHSVYRQLRFVPFEPPPLLAPVRYEWLAVVDHFRSGAPDPVWFLADPRRSDLVLFDPVATRTVREYRWEFQPDAVLGGARPAGVAWHHIERPGWMAAEGWALTPETRGVSERSRRAPAFGGALAYVARRPEAATVMVGGRNLGGPCTTAALLRATVDGREVGRWQLPAGDHFVFFAELPAGALDGPPGYGELRFTASDLSGAGALVDVSLEQFDVQSGRRPVVGLAKGWYEPELESATGETWRWASPRAELVVHNFDRDVVIDITAADPTSTLGHGVALQVQAAGRVIASRRFKARIEWEVAIPRAVIRDAGGRIMLTSDAAFVPDRTRRNGDQRELALRVLDIGVAFSE